MRYQCRPAGKPAFYDTKYPGTYNARRDNLEGFWKGLFGYTHGLMLVSAFYEKICPRNTPFLMTVINPITSIDLRLELKELRVRYSDR
jgi:hypothetical protein